MSFNQMHDEVMNEINMTPLIDVMLVLLIVFMVTLPAITNSVKIQLPSATNVPTDVKDAHLTLAVQSDGSIQLDGNGIDSTALADKLTTASAQSPQPSVQIHADKNVRYEVVAKLLSETQHAGLTKIDFVTQPNDKP